MKTKTNRQKILYICQAGITAGLYVVLTIVANAFGLANGAIQVRISEALCVLPAFFPSAITGLTLGCLLSNLLTGAIWQDIVFGTLATLIGAVGAYLLRKLPSWLVTLPTIVANTIIVPIVLAYAYHAEGGLPYLMLTVGIGEVISAGVLGTILCVILRRRHIFDQSKK